MRRYFDTIYHLRAAQILNRISRKFNTIKLDSPKVNGRRRLIREFSHSEMVLARMLGPSEFQFLNKKSMLNSADDWNNSRQEKLWLYNLHYFDDLASEGAESRSSWHSNLISRWIQDNPPALGIGWDPYPTSLRVVNWIKWFLVGNKPEESWLESLALQVHVLEQELEYHLLGNHLFANAKALVFSGLFFEGEAADQWLHVGLSILDNEIPEQILPDGGNFELSPMYHCIILHDMLDLINLTNTYAHPETAKRLHIWEETSSRMLGWMDKMLHPDNDIPFFNDTAMGIAPSPHKLRDYSQMLGIQSKSRAHALNSKQGEISLLENTGYVRLENPDCVIFLDCASVGPDYIPGHAHADTLSFEMSLGGSRVFVNSGISEYGISEERHRQRSTAAHNSVVVDSLNSSEVWSGFRVARRAQIIEREIHESGQGGLKVSASHDGFIKQGHRVQHCRTWSLYKNRCEIVDQLLGKYQSAVGYLHLHPEVKVTWVSESHVELNTSTHSITIEIEGAIAVLCNGSWHPEFGLSIPNKHIKLVFSKSAVTTRVKWQGII